MAETLGAQIRRRREELGMSQSELARATSLNPQQLGRYELGRNEPSLSIAARIADALGVTIDELAGRIPGLPTIEGEWWCLRETRWAGSPSTAQQRLHFTQRGRSLEFEPVEKRGERAEFLNRMPFWQGELRLWNTDKLVGWFKGDSPSSPYVGVLFLVLSPDGDAATGAWAGTDEGDDFVVGRCALLRRPQVGDPSAVPSILEAWSTTEPAWSHKAWG